MKISPDKYKDTIWNSPKHNLMDNLFKLANDMNGVDTDKFEHTLKSLEAKRSKSIHNKDHAIEQTEKWLQRLKMSIDRYKESPSDELLEQIHKLELEAQIVLELFKEDCIHPDQETHGKYSGVLSKFMSEID